MNEFLNLMKITKHSNNMDKKNVLLEALLVYNFK